MTCHLPYLPVLHPVAVPWLPYSRPLCPCLPLLCDNSRRFPHLFDLLSITLVDVIEMVKTTAGHRSLSPQLERDIAKVGEYHQNNEKRVPSWVCMPNKIGCHKERWFIVQRQDINLGMVDQRNGPEWTFDKTLPNWPSKRKQDCCSYPECCH